MIKIFTYLGQFVQERIRSANWHITSRCNYNCKFCFATDMGKELHDHKRQEEVLRALVDYGVEKLNLVGGEPLLHTDLVRLAQMGHDYGFVITIQTNGSLLTAEMLDQLSPYLSWVGISIDSGVESIESALGRGKGDHVKLIRRLCRSVRERGIGLKVNTTVTQLNWQEDMNGLIDELSPDRWKVFQTLIIQGQNDAAEYLTVSADQFDGFCGRHRDHVLRGGSSPTFERAEDMVGSYLMIGPRGDIMTNLDRKLVHLPLSLLFRESQRKIIDITRYRERGGVYDWRR